MKHDEQGLCKDKLKLKFCEILARCMENKPEDRYQRVEDIRQELQLLKNMLVVSKSRQGTMFKLEIAAVVILSIVSYTAVFLGFIHK